MSREGELGRTTSVQYKHSLCQTLVISTYDLTCVRHRLKHPHSSKFYRTTISLHSSYHLFLRHRKKFTEHLMNPEDIFLNAWTIPADCRHGKHFQKQVEPHAIILLVRVRTVHSCNNDHSCGTKKPLLFLTSKIFYMVLVNTQIPLQICTKTYVVTLLIWYGYICLLPIPTCLLLRQSQIIFTQAKLTTYFKISTSYVVMSFLSMQTFSQSYSFPSCTPLTYTSLQGQLQSWARSDKSLTFAANVRKHKVVSICHYFIFKVKYVHTFGIPIWNLKKWMLHTLRRCILNWHLM